MGSWPASHLGASTQTLQYGVWLRPPIKQTQIFKTAPDPTESYCDHSCPTDPAGLRGRFCPNRRARAGTSKAHLGRETHLRVLGISRLPGCPEPWGPKSQGLQGLQAYIWQGQRLQHPRTHSYILKSENKVGLASRGTKWESA